MMLNPGEYKNVRKFHDTISTIIEKNNITSQRSQSTLEQTDEATATKSPDFVNDRRHAVTASLKQRIKINQELTDSMRRNLRTRENYTK
jgi:hypothetical protein